MNIYKVYLERVEEFKDCGFELKEEYIETDGYTFLNSKEEMETFIDRSKDGKYYKNIVYQGTEERNKTVLTSSYPYYYSKPQTYTAYKVTFTYVTTRYYIEVKRKNC